MPLDDLKLSGASFVDYALFSTTSSGDVVSAVGVNGVFPVATLFDGADSYVQVTNNGQFNAPLHQGFSISVWIKPAGSGEGGAGRIFDLSDGGSAQNGLVLFNGNEFVQLTVGSASNIVSSGASSISYSGVWQHVVATMTSAARVDFYVDGVIKGGGTNNALSGITSSANPRIGNITGGLTRTFDGEMAHFRIYNRVLSVNEIGNLYRGRI